METVLKQSLYTWFGSFLEYPEANLCESHELFATEVERDHPEAFLYLKEFLRLMSSFDISMRQEHYVQTFDVMPRCSLYLSVQLFGEESFKRAELMAGLKSAYEKHQVYEMVELPDHLAVILKNNDVFKDEDWAELVSMCILPALPGLIGELEKSKNPYSLLLKAIRVFMKQQEKICV